MSGESDQRIHTVSGASNFRDFGGYVTGDGRRVAAGRVFRSANLAKLDGNGLVKLTALGIATIVDLRGVDEAARAPTVLGEGVGITIISVPIEPSSVQGEPVSPPDGPADHRANITRAYRNFVAVAGPHFGRALLAIAENSDRPVLVQCTAGKDRTGLTVALIHSLLGVSESDMVADFETTNRAWDGGSATHSLAHIGDEATRKAMLAADPEYLALAFNEIASRHGSVEAFVVKMSGDPNIAERLRKALLVVDAAAA